MVHSLHPCSPVQFSYESYEWDASSSPNCTPTSVQETRKAACQVSHSLSENTYRRVASSWKSHEQVKTS